MIMPIQQKPSRAAAPVAWRYRVIDGPLGAFMLMESESGELATEWMMHASASRLRAMREDSGLQPDLSRRLAAHFRGKVVSFDDVATPGGPPFHRACWHACRSIPRGEVISYAQLAAIAGNDASAARAAGQAMRANRLPVIIPCHRVVASDGRLHGYTGSDDPCSSALALKRGLLTIENPERWSSSNHATTNIVHPATNRTTRTSRRRTQSRAGASLRRA
jgi:methylated-DNA-[protein]-cysteine S-methyltransferase